MSLFQDNSIIDIDSVKTKYTKPDGTIDTDALLKKAAHADVHIANLEKEQAGLREELQTRLALERVMEEIKTLKPTNHNISDPVVQSQHQMTNERDDSKLTAQEIENMIASRLKNEREQSQKARNVAMIEQELAKIWGPAWKAELQRKTQSEGLNKDRLAELAETEPAMFLRLINPQPMNTDVSPPTNRMIPAIDNNGNVKNYKYFEAIRKKSAAEYWSPQVQRELHRQAALLGDSFYNN